MNELQLSNDLNVITAEINSYKQVAGQAIFEIGKRLKHAKENDLVHGEFGKWLESIEMDKRTAQQMIKIASDPQLNTSTYTHLGTRALYEIATLPKEEREKEHITSMGESKTPDEMTVRELQDVKRQYMVEQAEKGIISPLIVNGEMIVIDGQNRLHHSMMVGAPVKYVIDETLTIDDIARMNTNQEKWTLLDWIESYANEGREEYEKLIKILNDYYSDATLVSGLCVNTTSNSETRNIVKSGNFKINNHEMIISFFQYLKRFIEETKSNKNSPTTKAVYQLYRIKKLERDRLINKVRATRFDEELQDKRMTQTAVLRGLLDSYNDRLGGSSSTRIEYHIRSNGQIIIDEDLHDWAEKKTDFNGQ